ncbi:MAG: hypothetical protein U5L96_04230 [Owenweeksia sp.]|nr:hypothetical protein [Owenweeksia sp.]
MKTSRALEDCYSVESVVSPGYTIRSVSATLRLGDFFGTCVLAPGFAAT